MREITQFSSARRHFISTAPVAAAGALLGAGPASSEPVPAASSSSVESAIIAAGDGLAKPVLVFDVIETLLDLEALAPKFQQAFGTAAALPEFFSQMLQSAFAITAANAYTDFGQVAKAALAMTAERRGIRLTDDGSMEILRAIRSLPPHPEVKDSLERLQSAGFRMVALTNSALPVLEAQVDNAGLRRHFERLFSVDSIKKFKPAPEVYRHVGSSLGLQPRQMMMVAAHSWDVGGAMKAGLLAAFVARPGMVLDPLFARPSIVGTDLSAVAEQIIRSRPATSTS